VNPTVEATAASGSVEETSSKKAQVVDEKEKKK
jgi:hypothetical protein